MNGRKYGLLIVALCLIAQGCTGNTVSVDPSERVPSYESTEEAGSETEPSTEDLTEPESETEEPTEEPSTVSPNIGLTALAVVPNYVNVRKGPSTEYDIVGKIYNYCAAEILDETEGEDGNWFLITSGNVKGYIKAEFFLVGEEAEEMKASVGVLKGVVEEDYLRVRSEPDLSTLDNVFTFYERGTEVYIKELKDGWAKIESDDASAGYVYAECLSISRVFKTAITLEEEEAELERKKQAEERARKAQEELEAARRLAAEAEEARRHAQEVANQQNANQQELANAAKAAAEAAEAAARANDDALNATRNALVAYALQFVGNPYVHGGRSLVTGTDCSGFTKLVYQHFGYNDLVWYPAGQAEQGIPADLSDLKPGDLLFYSNAQKYLGHVAIYIGNGQIVHAGTEETGILVMSAYYRNPLFARRFIY